MAAAVGGTAAHAVQAEGSASGEGLCRDQSPPVPPRPSQGEATQRVQSGARWAADVRWQGDGGPFAAAPGTGPSSRQ
eukprot:8117088-Alexandrium_andersonii.AAC.1